MSEIKQNLINYRLTMSVAMSMLKKGIINEKEYRRIDTIIAKKHGISLYSIFG